VSAHRGRLTLYRTGQAHARHGFVESFNGRLRDELLNETLFSSLGEARHEIALWQHDYNHHRPHSGIGNIPPAEFVAQKGLAMHAA